MKKNITQNKKKTAQAKAPKAGMTRTVTAPTAKGSQSHGSTAKFSSSPRGGVKITHTEFLSSVRFDPGNEMINDQLWAYTIQPGFQECFPWLAGIASKFERYQFTKLSYEFRAACPTTAAGVVVIGVDYDVDDIHNPGAIEGVESDRIAVLSLRDSLQTPLWQSARLVVPPEKLRALGARYVMAGVDANVMEPRTSHLGVVYIGHYGAYGSLQWVGDVFVSYEIELTEPQLATTENLPSTSSLVLSCPLGTTPLMDGANIPDKLGTQLVVYKYDSKDAVGDDVFHVEGPMDGHYWFQFDRDYFGVLLIEGVIQANAEIPPDSVSLNGTYHLETADTTGQPLEAMIPTVTHMSWSEILSSAYGFSLALQKVWIYGSFHARTLYRLYTTAISVYDLYAVTAHLYHLSANAPANHYQLPVAKRTKHQQPPSPAAAPSLPQSPGSCPVPRVLPTGPRENPGKDAATRRCKE